MASSAGEPGGGNTIVEQRLVTPWPEASVSQVMKSGGRSMVRVTARAAMSISVTTELFEGSYVMKWLR